MAKPRMNATGECSSSLQKSHNPDRQQEPGNDDSVAAKSGVASILLEEFLVAIVCETGASAGVVRVLSPDGLSMRAAGWVGLPGGHCQCEITVDSQCGICGKAVASGQIESSDAEYCRSRFGDAFFGRSCQFVISAPMGEESSDRGPQGVLTLFFAKAVDEEERVRKTLHTSSSLLRIALRHAWKNEDRHQHELLAERQAIANEIHDSLAQTLYFAKMRSSLLMDALKSENDLLSFKCAQDVDEALATGQKTVRELVTHFRCQMDPRGIRFALEKLASSFETRTGIQMDYAGVPEGFVLPGEYELQAFLIVREALVNIASHSGANSAKLTVLQHERRCKFIVEDNGEGLASTVPREGHFGLAIMRERAVRIGGEMKVENLDGHGTRVMLEFDVPETLPDKH